MIQKYSIDTPPYGKGRIELDEKGTLVKFSDVEFLLHAVEKLLTVDCEFILEHSSVDKETAYRAFRAIHAVKTAFEDTMNKLLNQREYIS